MQFFYGAIVILLSLLSFFPANNAFARAENEQPVPHANGTIYDETGKHISKSACRNILDDISNFLRNNFDQSSFERLVQKKGEILNCYQKYSPDDEWAAYGMIASVYFGAKDFASARPLLEEALLLAPEIVGGNRERESQIFNIAIAQLAAATYTALGENDLNLSVSKKYLPDVIIVMPENHSSEFFIAFALGYNNSRRYAPAVFYAKLAAGGVYAQGRLAADDLLWKTETSRYLKNAGRENEIALFDKLPAGPSPEGISPFSPARVLMVGPEIALFDRFERLATALQQAAASDDPATLHAARENMRAWMDEVERELK